MKTRNFNEIYANLVKGKNPILDELQRRKQITGIIGIICIVLFFLFLVVFSQSGSMLIYILIIVGVLDAIIYFLTAGKHRSLYKQTAIASLIREYSPTLSFNGRAGITEMEYRKAGYKEHYDRFYSEDLIQGIIDDEFKIKMSEVKTERREVRTDSKGHVHTEYVTVFHGIYGFIDVTDKLLPYFEISTNNFFGKYANSRVEVDSSNFEKYYDLYTNDKVRTMEIFTSDLIEEFNHFKEELKSPIQMKVAYGHLFFRISMKNSFEAPTFGESLNFDSMYHNFKLIDSPMRLISRVFENAKDVQ